MTRSKVKSKRYRIIPYFCLCLLMFAICLFVNFERLVYEFGMGYYDSTSAVVLERGKDPLFGVLPRVKFQYNYGGTDYTHDKILLTQMLFVKGVSDHETIQVNKFSPDDFLIPMEFQYSYINWVAWCIQLFCFCMIIQNIRRNFLRRRLLKQSKAKKKGEQENE